MLLQHLQQEIRPTSSAQLAVEVKGIYDGLLKVEQRCLDEIQNDAALGRDVSPMSNEQWQALISLHKALLHEHHDFFRAPQHAGASGSLEDLASPATARLLDPSPLPGLIPEQYYNTFTDSSLLPVVDNRLQASSGLGVSPDKSRRLKLRQAMIDARARAREFARGLQGRVQAITSHSDSVKKSLSKVKRGLPGFVNGVRVSAFPDTGSSRNVVSLAFAQDRKLDVQGKPTHLRLGNSSYTKSLGTVKVDWAFSESPLDVSKIICDVLPRCNYPLILGSRFLGATQTLSKFRSRLSECLFSTANVLGLNFLESDESRLHGYLGGDDKARVAVAAVPDTGAEGNIMDENFAIEHGFCIRKGPNHRNLLQFADGTTQWTVGQAETHWTFESGESIPITFEVLENCSSDVILGDTILYDHNVFEDHASSISSYDLPYGIHHLAPFDFVKNWQRPPSNKQLYDLESERQDAWDCQFSFGETATEAENAAERLRRDRHKLALQSLLPTPSETRQPHPRTIAVSSLATAPNRSRQSQSLTNARP
ncbi:MAG: hypothetical protein Q9168_007065 [Polycauliona sp. 1 TL-2023]